MKKLEGYQLAALIERAEYQRFGATTTVCALILNNGFVVIGVSGCLMVFYCLRCFVCRFVHYKIAHFP